MIERRPTMGLPFQNRSEPHTKGGNGSLGLPRTIHESAKPPPESAVNKPALTPEERREKRLKYLSDYKKRNKDKVSAYQKRYRSHDPSIRPNEKLHAVSMAASAEERNGNESRKPMSHQLTSDKKNTNRVKSYKYFPLPPEK